MIISTGILLLGLLLIYWEFFLPGGIVGTAGGLLVVTSVGMFAARSNSIAMILLFLVLAIAGTVLVIRLALHRIQKADPGRSVYLSSDQSGYVASSFDAEVVGQEGKAVSDLKPSGFISVAGKRYQAISLAGYVPKGTEVSVTGGRGAYLTVKISKKDAVT